VANVTISSNNYHIGDAYRCIAGPWWLTTDVGYIGLRDGTVVRKTEMYKSTDKGATWTEQDATNAPGGDSDRTFHHCFDKDIPGDTGTLIHVVRNNIGDDDIHYEVFDTSTDTWAVRTDVITVTDGSDTSPFDNSLWFTKSRSGRLVCVYQIRTATGYFTGHRISDNNGSTWSSKADPNLGAVNDHCWIFPDENAADTDDMILVRYDSSGTLLEWALYDASADTIGSWTAIDSNVVKDTWVQHGGMISFTINPVAKSIDMVYFSDEDTATGDFRCGRLTSSGFTAKTNLHTDIDDSFYPCLAVDPNNGDLYAAYCGKDDGSEIHNSSVSVVFKKSTDAMTTWGTEQAYSDGTGKYQEVVHGMRVTYDTAAGGRYMPHWILEAAGANSASYVNDGNDVEIAAASAAAVGNVFRSPIFVGNN